LLGPAETKDALFTLPDGSTSTFTRTLMVPRIVPLADLDTEGSTCCRTALWREEETGTSATESAGSSGAGSTSRATAAGFWLMPGFRAEGFAAAAGSSCNFTTLFPFSEEFSEDDSGERWTEGAEEFSAGRSGETADAG